MTQRLPVPGSDDGDWGDILNAFLEVAHDANGNLLPNAVASAASGSFAPLASGIVPTTNLGSGTATNVTYLRGDGSWSTPAAGVTLDTTASDIQPLGTQASGSSGLAADARHVHAMPTLNQISAPTSSLALNSQKITGLANGTAATDAAAYGQIPVTAAAIGGLLAANNLSELSSSANTALTNLGALSSANAAITYTPLTNRDHVNLLEFSAAPDGTTNNSAAIAAAVAAAEEGSHRLFIPRQANPWIIGTPVVIGTNTDIEIFSDGWDTTSGFSTIKLATGVNDYAFKFATNRAGGNHIIFRDIEIDGNYSGQTTNGGCVAAYNAVQCLFDHVHFHHAYNNALWLCGQQGSGPFGHHNRIVNSLFDNSMGSAGSGIALNIQATDENMIAECDFESNGNGTYHIIDAAGINGFTNCVFVGGSMAIYGSNVSGSRVIGCMFDGVGGDGVHVSGYNWMISANHFSGASGTTNSYKSVVLDNGGYCSVVGNVFDSGTTNQELRSFISSYPSSTYNAVSGNVFRINTGSLGDGGVYDWNGGSATASNSLIRGNPGLADAG